MSSGLDPAILARINQQDPTLPDLPRPHRETLGRGLVVRLERIPDLTPAGLLEDPFVFQVAPLNSFPINRSYPQSVYDTIGKEQRSRPGVTQLRTISYDTIFCESCDPPGARRDGEPTPEAVCESSLTGHPGKAAKLRRMNGLWKQGMIMLYDYLSPAVEWTWATYNAC